MVELSTLGATIKDAYDDEPSAFTDAQFTKLAAIDQGVATTDSPQFAAVNIGHASDTTLARSAAGRATIEGKNVVLSEQGTWTPVLADASTGGNVASFTNSNSSYRRFHTTARSLIHLQLRCSAIDTTGMTGGNDLFIRGLPFAAQNSSDHQGPVGLYRITYTGFVNVQPSRTTTYARLEESVSGAVLDYVTVGELVSPSAAISFNIWYEATT